MTIGCILASAASVAFAFLCVAFRRKNKSFTGMLFKFLASVAFISVSLIGFLSNPVNPNYFIMICFGLLFGLMGDVLLGIKEIAPVFRSKLILYGTASFLLGHFFYIAGFISLSGFKKVTMLFFLLGVAICLLLIKITKAQVKGKFIIIMPIYFGVLVFKAATAFCCMLTQLCPTTILAFISCLLFIISDTCLGFLYFTPVKKKNALVTAELITYYPAQLLLAMGIALM